MVTVELLSTIVAPLALFNVTVNASFGSSIASSLMPTVICRRVTPDAKVRVPFVAS